MGRPSDWSVVGYYSDPVPGDPVLVEELARRYTKTADAIRTAVDGLQEITDRTDGQQSKAITELRKKAEEAGTDIGKAERRYREAGSALEAYAPELDEAQRMSASAHASATEAANAPKPEGEDADPAEDSAEDPGITAAKAKVAEAVGIRDTAAQKCAGAIDDVIGTDGLKDGFWDNLGGVLKVVENIAGWVATVAGVLALVFCWVPVVGQALAAIALVATAVSLVCKIGLGGITGDWNLKGMAMDVVGLATFGIGRAFSGAARLTSMTARARALPVARTISRTGAPGQRVATLMGGRFTNRMARSAPRAATTGRSQLGSAFTGSFGESGRAIWNVATRARGTWTTARRPSSFTEAVDTYLGAGENITRLRHLDPQILSRSDEVADLSSLALRQNGVAIGANSVGTGSTMYGTGDFVNDSFLKNTVTGDPQPMGYTAR